MPKYLKLIARFANSGLALLCFILVIVSLGVGKPAGIALGLLFGTLFAFSLYLIEKAASILENPLASGAKHN